MAASLLTPTSLRLSTLSAAGGKEGENSYCPETVKKEIIMLIK
jgi:hypothetical protein